MKIDVHSHQIEEVFLDALRALPGVTIKTNPDRFSYLLKDGKTWLPFRPEMFDPDHLIREMDRKGIDISILSMNTPSVYVFEPEDPHRPRAPPQRFPSPRVIRHLDPGRGFADAAPARRRGFAHRIGTD